MDKFVDFVEAKYLKKNIAKFNVGDTVDVKLKIVEEDKSRLQTYEGVVIAKAGSGLRETFTVRKVSYGEGVEMVLPLHSPSIEKIEVVRKGDVRRAKLYFLKKKVGKESKVEEKIEHSTENNTAQPPREEAQ